MAGVQDLPIPVLSHSHPGNGPGSVWEFTTNPGALGQRRSRTAGRGSPLARDTGQWSSSVKASSPTPRSEQAFSAERQVSLRRLGRANLVALLGAVLELALDLIWNPPLLLAIAKLVIMVILVLVIGIAAIRFSFLQRGAYCRERGRDPEEIERSRTVGPEGRKARGWPKLIRKNVAAA